MTREEAEEKAEQAVALEIIEHDQEEAYVEFLMKESEINC